MAAIRRGLSELLAHFPVYRTYVAARGRSAADAAIMTKVCAAAQQTCRPGERSLAKQIESWLGPPPEADGASAVLARRQRPAADTIQPVRDRRAYVRERVWNVVDIAEVAISTKT